MAVQSGMGCISNGKVGSMSGRYDASDVGRGNLLESGCSEAENMVNLVYRLQIECNSSIQSIYDLMRDMGISTNPETARPFEEDCKYPEKAPLPAFTDVWRNMNGWFDQKSSDLHKIVNSLEDSLYGVMTKDSVCEKEPTPSSYTSVLYTAILHFDNAVDRLVMFTKRMNVDIESPFGQDDQKEKPMARSFVEIWKNIPTILATQKGVIDSCRETLKSNVMSVNTMPEKNVQSVRQSFPR